MRYTINKETLESIADAIRTKTGGSDKLSPSAMPTAIAGIQTGVMPLGNYVTAPAAENIAGGEWVNLKNFNEYKPINYNGTPYMKMWNIGTDPDGNDLFFIYHQYETGKTSKVYNMAKICKVENGVLTTLIEKVDYFTTYNPSYVTISTAYIMNVIRLPGTNKIHVLCLQSEKYSPYKNYLYGKIYEINFTDNTISGVGSGITSPYYSTGSQSMETGNILKATYFDVERKKLIFYTPCNDDYISVKDGTIDVITFNDDYSTFTWTVTLCPKQFFTRSVNSISLLNAENQIYIVHGSYKSTSSYTLPTALVFQINSDNTISSIQDLLDILAYDRYSSNNNNVNNKDIHKLDDTHFLYIASSALNYSGYCDFRFGLLTMADDYTLTISWTSASYASKTLRSGKTGVWVFPLGNKSFELIAPYSRNESSPYKATDPQRINITVDTTVTTSFVTVDSLIIDDSLLNESKFLSYNTTNGYYAKNDHDFYVVDTDPNGYINTIYQYIGKHFVKTTSVDPYGIACHNAVANENLKVCTK